MIDFEDLNTYNGLTAFPICNESIEIWREGLEGISVENAAGICSGGEVSFFAILPSVTGQLQLIDHAYVALYYAIGKYHAIEKLGAEEAYKAFVQGDMTILSPLFKGANEGLPTKPDNGYDSYRTCDSYGLKRYYKSVSQETFETFQENKKRVKFLHGDICDLAERGPFDLLYISNALDYAGRNGEYAYPIDKIVKPGGIVCYTGASRYGSSRYGSLGTTDLSKYEVLFTKKSTLPMSWTYNVAKAPE